MAFKKKTWVDRMVEYAGRRKITNVTTMAAQIVDVERAEGVVSEEGTAINAVNMNDLEQRTADAFSAVQQDIEGINSDLGGCQFGITSDGLPGYKKVGADTVYPFKNDFKVAKVTRSWSRWSADLGNNFRYDGSLVEQPDYKSFVIEKNLFLGIVYGRQRQVGIGIGPSISYNSTNGSFSLTTNGNWEITSCVLYIIRLN